MIKKTPLTVDDLGGESREGFSSSALFERLDRYSKAKENSSQFSDYLAVCGEEKLAEALAGCGNRALFHDYFTVGEIHLAEFHTCKKHLLCPLCAILRAGRALRIYLERFKVLMASDPFIRSYLVTLTVVNGEDLEERYNHLTAGVCAYHKRRKGTRQIGEVLKASSAVWSYEFTNKGNGWHPHMHSVWLCHEAPDPFKLSQEWREITGDSFVVDVRPLDMTDPVGALCEVFKYATKFAGLSDEHRFTAYQVLKGRRLIGSFGGLRGLKVDLSDFDRLIDDLPYVERLFYFIRGEGYLERVMDSYSSAA